MGYASKCARCEAEGVRTRRGSRGSDYRRALVCLPCSFAICKERNERSAAKARRDTRTGSPRWFSLAG
jgi:hypothetical protein